jgi:hypothetical protein
MAAGASALLVAIGGGTAAVAALTDDKPTVVRAVGQGTDVPAAPAGAVGATAEKQPAGPVDAEPPAADTGLGAQPAEAGDTRISAEANRTATREPRRDTAAAPAAAAAPVPAAPAAPAAAPAGPVVTTQTVTEKRAIPYRTRLVRDPQLARGRKRIQTPGALGEETLRYLVTYSGGRQTDRRLVDAQVTKQPQHRVVAFGTQRGRGGKKCGPGIGNCLPIGRGAVCPETSAQAPADAPAETPGKEESGSLLAALDQNLDVLSAEDLSKLELDATALCRAADEAEAAERK